MEDILVQVLSLCSVETLVWIQCDEGKVLGLSLVALRYLLHKRVKEVATYRSIQVNSLQDLIQQLNKQQLCTTQVSDSYRSRHWKQHFLINQFAKRCARNGLHDFLEQWLKEQNVDVFDNYWLKITISASNPSAIEDDYDLLERAFKYALKRGYDIDKFPLYNVDNYNMTVAAILYNRWDLLKSCRWRLVDIRSESINLRNYNLFMKPSECIPEKYNYYLCCSENLIVFESLSSVRQQELLQYIACKYPKFLRHFILTKDQIRSLYNSFKQHIRIYNTRGLVRYLREHGLWEEFPYDNNKKSFYLLLTQLHDREPVDIDAVIELLKNDECYESDYHWVLFALIEWYNVDKARLKHIAKKIVLSRFRSIYLAYIKRIV